MIHAEDNASEFGRWPDATSRLMYHDVMELALEDVDTSGRVADYGGANGLLKEWIPHAISIDYDASKNPDINEDILLHVGSYDLIVMRYVLHYMDDKTVLRLMRHLARHHDGKILVIQFVNEDLVSKLANSVGETKWFRDERDLRTLLEIDWHIDTRRWVDYRVEAEFYRNRLNHPNPSAHDETIVIYELSKK